MKILKNIIKQIANKLILLLVLIFIPLISSAQNNKAAIPNDSSKISQSKYSLGIIGGYTALLTRSASDLTGDIKDANVVNGGSIGFIFDYKIGNSKSSIQFLSETNYLYFKRADKESYENISFNLLGVKIKFKENSILYLLPEVGIMTGIETQFIRSISIGFDFSEIQNRKFFGQIGVADTDMKDDFINIRFGILFSL